MGRLFNKRVEETDEPLKPPLSSSQIMPRKKKVKAQAKLPALACDGQLIRNTNVVRSGYSGRFISTMNRDE